MYHANPRKLVTCQKIWLKKMNPRVTEKTGNNHNNVAIPEPEASAPQFPDITKVMKRILYK